MKKQVVKKKGFSFLSFFLGILLGIILVVGAVAGGVAFVLFSDLESVFNVANVQNKDENGDYIYINTDTENGGVKNALELIKTLVSMSSDYQNLTLGQIENLVPVSSSVVDQVYEAVSPYVEIDMDEVRSVKFSEFAGWLQDTVLDIRVASLAEKFGFGGEQADNAVVKAFLYGSEAAYVTDGQVNYPVWYDTYVSENDAYYCGGRMLDKNLEQYLIGQEDGSYRLFFFAYGDSHYITQKTENGYEYSLSAEYATYAEETAVLTGNYYTDAEGNRVDVDPVTIRMLSENPLGAIEQMYVTELFGQTDELVEEILGGVTVGELMDGSVDFEEIVKNLEITKLISLSPTDDLMMYLGYGITNAVLAEENLYRGVCEIDGVSVPCSIRVEDGKVAEVYTGTDDNKTAVKGTTVGGLNDRINGITLPVFLDVKRDEPIMVYLGYGVYGLTETDDPSVYTGKYDLSDTESVSCTVTTDADGYVISVTYEDENGAVVAVKGTGIDDINGRITGMTERLTIGEIVEIDEKNAIMKAIANSTISSLATDVNNLSVNELYANDIYGAYDAAANAQVAVLKKAVAADAGEGEILFDPDYVYFVKDGDRLVVVNADDGDSSNDGKLSALPADGEYWTYGQATALWKLLIYKEDTEKVYHVSEMNAMIYNVTTNIQSSTLNDLCDAKIIEMDAGAREKTLAGTSKKLGEMTLSELIIYVENVANSQP